MRVCAHACVRTCVCALCASAISLPSPWCTSPCPLPFHTHKVAMHRGHMTHISLRVPHRGVKAHAYLNTGSKQRGQSAHVSLHRGLHTEGTQDTHVPLRCTPLCPLPILTPHSCNAEGTRDTHIFTQVRNRVDTEHTHINVGSAIHRVCQLLFQHKHTSIPLCVCGMDFVSVLDTFQIIASYVIKHDSPFLPPVCDTTQVPFFNVRHSTFSNSTLLITTLLTVTAPPPYLTQYT
jgi:hypothetical protein